jgi:TIR domain
MAYDLFVSYRRKDASRVLPLVDLLREQHGLRVWMDQSDIESFESTTRSIAVGLTQSRGCSRGIPCSTRSPALASGS